MEAKKNEGNEAFKASDFEGAIALYSEALAMEASPEVEAAQRHLLLCNRAAAKLALKRFTEAQADCEHCVALNPKYAKGYLRLAMALKGQGMLRQALDVARKGLAEIGDAPSDTPPGSTDPPANVPGMPELQRFVRTSSADLEQAERQARKLELARQRKMHGGAANAPSPELMEEFNKLSSKIRETNAALEAVTRKIRQEEVSLHHLSSLSDDSVAYQAVGRVFLRQTPQELRKLHQSDLDAYKQQEASLQKSMAFHQRNMEGISNELQEMIS